MANDMRSQIQESYDSLSKRIDYLEKLLNGSEEELKAALELINFAKRNRETDTSLDVEKDIKDMDMEELTKLSRQYLNEIKAARDDIVKTARANGIDLENSRETREEPERAKTRNPFKIIANFFKGLVQTFRDSAAQQAQEKAERNQQRDEQRAQTKAARAETKAKKSQTKAQTKATRKAERETSLNEMQTKIYDTLDNVADKKNDIVLRAQQRLDEMPRKQVEKLKKHILNDKKLTYVDKIQKLAELSASKNIEIAVQMYEPGQPDPRILSFVPDRDGVAVSVLKVDGLKADISKNHAPNWRNTLSRDKDVPAMYLEYEPAERKGLHVEISDRNLNIIERMGYYYDAEGHDPTELVPLQEGLGISYEAYLKDRHDVEREDTVARRRESRQGAREDRAWERSVKDTPFISIKKEIEERRAELKETMAFTEKKIANFRQKSMGMSVADRAREMEDSLRTRRLENEEMGMLTARESLLKRIDPKTPGINSDEIQSIAKEAKNFKGSLSKDDVNKLMDAIFKDLALSKSFGRSTDDSTDLDNVFEFIVTNRIVDAINEVDHQFMQDYVKENADMFEMVKTAFEYDDGIITRLMEIEGIALDTPVHQHTQEQSKPEQTQQHTQEQAQQHTQEQAQQHTQEQAKPQQPNRPKPPLRTDVLQMTQEESDALMKALSKVIGSTRKEVGTQTITFAAREVGYIDATKTTRPEITINLSYEKGKTSFEIRGSHADERVKVESEKFFDYARIRDQNGRYMKAEVAFDSVVNAIQRCAKAEILNEAALSYSGRDTSRSFTKADRMDAMQIISQDRNAMTSFIDHVAEVRGCAALEISPKSDEFMNFGIENALQEYVSSITPSDANSDRVVIVNSSEEIPADSIAYVTRDNIMITNDGKPIFIAEDGETRVANYDTDLSPDTQEQISENISNHIQELRTPRQVEQVEITADPEIEAMASQAIFQEAAEQQAVGREALHDRNNRGSRSRSPRSAEQREQVSQSGFSYSD